MRMSEGSARTRELSLPKTIGRHSLFRDNLVMRSENGDREPGGASGHGEEAIAETDRVGGVNAMRVVVMTTDTVASFAYNPGTVFKHTGNGGKSAVVGERHLRRVAGTTGTDKQHARKQP